MEKQCVILMGGLNVQMTMLKVISSWLDESGWSYVLTSSNVTTEECAAGLLRGAHISRGQWTSFRSHMQNSTLLMMNR